MNDAVLLRPCRGADAEAIRAVFLRAVRQTASAHYSAEQIEAWAPLGGDRARWIADRFDANTWVAERHGRVVGFTDLDTSHGHIGMLFVDPDAARLGIGTALIARNLDEARSAGLSAVTVEASITARPLLERRGFTVLKRQRVIRRNTVMRNYLMRTNVDASEPLIAANEKVMLRSDPRTAEYPALLEIWRSAVQSTHHFVAENHLAEIEAQLSTVYLPSVRITVAELSGRPVGFSGTSAGSLEMLFVHDAYRGRGVGSALLRNAIRTEKVGRVDVNEQNQDAVAFYRARDFVTIGGSAVDGDGRPYPILHMVHRAGGAQQ